MVHRYYAAVINGYRARSRTRSDFLVAIRMILFNQLEIKQKMKSGKRQ